MKMTTEDSTKLMKKVNRVHHHQNNCELMKTRDDGEIESRHITAFVL